MASWATLGAALLFLLADKYLTEVFLCFWRNATENWLSVWEVRFFLIGAVLAIFCLPALYKTLKTEWAKISLRNRRLLLLITLLAVLLRLLLPPAGHRLYFDEDIYLNIGQNIANTGQALLTNCGETRYGVYHHYEGIFNKQPNSLPFMAALVFAVFGCKENLIFLLMQILGGLTVLPLFGLAMKLFSEEEGLWAAFLFALIPVHIIWSATASTETAFVFFAALSLYLLMLALSAESLPLWLLFVCSIAFTVQFRTEGLLILIPAGLMILFSKVRIKTWWAILMGLALAFLLFPILLHLNFVKDMDWGAPGGQKFSLDYFTVNWRNNLPFFWENRYFPAFCSVFMLLGIAGCLFRRKLWTAVWLLIWAGLFFAPYLFFYAGDYKGGVSVRYALPHLAPDMILAGSGVVLLLKWLRERIKSFDPAIPLASALLLLFLFHVPLIKAVTQESWVARADHKYITEFCRNLPDNCFILTHSPSLVLVEGKGALQTWILKDNLRFQQMFESRKSQVFLYEDYWSDVYPQSQDVKIIKDNFELKLEKANRENGRTFNIYRLSSPIPKGKAAAKPGWDTENSGEEN